MAGRSNYRVKVDLSKYHQDARRSSWIYVNSTDVWFISHLKRHIKDVFGIDEPFHLLLNGNGYLPPAEDVRILNENEIIVVEPGSGLSNTSENVSPMSMPSSDIENGFVKDISTTDEAAPYQHKTKHETLNGSQNENHNTNNDSKADATMYHSMLEVTENESGSDTKRTNDSLNCSAINVHGAPSHKRRRIRRKKISKQVETSLYEIMDRHKTPNFNKPKIINSYTLPSGTHIRFDNMNNDVNKIDNTTNKSIEINENQTICSTVTSVPFFKKSSGDDLSTLLGLKNCSSPLMFVNKKSKYVRGNGSDLQTENDDTSCMPNDTPSLQSSNSSIVNNIRANFEEKNKYSDVKPEEYPPLESITDIGDVIAFKILRMGSSYEPEVSKYIIAKVLDYHPEKIMYTLQILRGRNEIEEPSGKFSLPENETNNDKTDKVEFKPSDLLESRLIDKNKYG